MWKLDYDIGIFTMARNTNTVEGFINKDSFNYLCDKDGSADNKDIDHMLVRALHRYKAVIISYGSEETIEKGETLATILEYGNQFESIGIKLITRYKHNPVFLEGYKGFITILKKLKNRHKKGESCERYVQNLKGAIHKILKSISRRDKYSSTFLNDYNKIITSSAFRRLQDKAQVFPLEMYDYARTRLTHTIEVSSIASEIANIIGKRINWKIEKDRACYSIEKIIECASLIHDMGNPPYGHYGEDIIRRFYGDKWENLETIKYSYDENNNLKKQDCSKISEIIKKEDDSQMYNDFVCFDGNAQAIRVMTKLQRFKDAQPLELSLSILGAMIKYPFNSVDGKDNKKFGYFYSERDVIRRLEIFGAFKKGCRNPLSMILEAADDISYVTSDLEDAVKKGVITKEIFDNEIDKLVKDGNTQECINDFINDYRHFYEESINRGIKDPFLYTISRLVDRLKKTLLLQVSDAFYKNFESIKYGISFEGEKGDGKNKDGKAIELIKYHEVKNKGVADWIKDTIFPRYLYNNKGIIQSELIGDEVLTTLLREFSEAILVLNFDKCGDKRPHTENKKDYFREQKVFSLISSNFVEGFLKEYDNAKDEKEKVYYKLRLVVDYVTGMTDSYALECYRIIKGIQ